MQSLPVRPDLHQVARKGPVRGMVGLDGLGGDVDLKLEGRDAIGGGDGRAGRTGVNHVPRRQTDEHGQEAQDQRCPALARARMLRFDLGLLRIIDLLFDDVLDEISRRLRLPESPGAFRHRFRNLAMEARKSGVARLAALTSAESWMPASNRTPSS